jgi:hypothetical protein
MYEYPFQALVFLLFAGGLRSFSLINRLASVRFKRHRDHLRLVHGGVSKNEPGLDLGKKKTLANVEDEAEPKLDRAA